MFITLSQEIEIWARAIKGTVRHRDKMLLEQFLKSATLLRKQLERSVDLNVMDEQGRVFSEVLEMIFKGDTQKRNELFALMKAWCDGRVELRDAEVEIHDEVNSAVTSPDQK